MYCSNQYIASSQDRRLHHVTRYLITRLWCLYLCNSNSLKTNRNLVGLLHIRLLLNHSPVSRALVTLPCKGSFSPITSQGCIFTGISVEKYVGVVPQIYKIFKLKKSLVSELARELILCRKRRVDVLSLVDHLSSYVGLEFILLHQWISAMRERGQM